MPDEIVKRTVDALYARLAEFTRSGRKPDVVSELRKAAESHVCDGWPWEKLLDAATVEIKRREAAQKN